jgi:hypothetical protein
MNYDVKGAFHEACDCEIVCSCWAGFDPDMGTCTGLFAWAIDTGDVGGVGVAGCKVIVLSQGTSCNQADHMLVLIDGNAAQIAALQSATRTGPWGDVIALSGGVPEFVPANIVIGANSLSASLKVPEPTRTIEVEANYRFTTVEMADSAPTRLISRVTGLSPSTVDVGTVKTAGPNNVGLNMLAEIRAPGSPSYIFDLDLTRVTAMRGAFHYREA